MNCRRVANAVATIALSSVAAAQCPDGIWEPVPGLLPVPTGSATDAVLWDPDGSGPLPIWTVVSGRFTAAGSVISNDVAAWDGDRWHAFPDRGPTDDVWALCVWNGNLVAGGWGSVSMYDGSSWISLGTVPGRVTGLEVLGTELVASIEPTSFPANCVRRWSGSSWEPLGSLNAVSRSLELHQGELFVSVAQGVYRWDNSAWVLLASTGAPSGAAVLYSDGNSLFAAGAGVGGTGSAVARWNGSMWVRLGPALATSSLNDINELCMFGGDLYALGGFTTASGAPSSGIMRWDGTQWVAVSAGVNSQIRAATASPTHMAIAGDTSLCWAWNGTAVEAIGSILNGPLVTSPRLASYDGSLVASGLFVPTSGLNFPLTRLATRAQLEWAPVSGTSGTFGAVHATDTDLFVAVTQLSTPTGMANGIARWNGQAWSNLGTGVSGTSSGLRVFAMAHDGPAVVVGGSFTGAGGAPANRIARWENEAWFALGDGIGDGQVNAVLVPPPLSGAPMFVAGTFSQAGGQPAASIASWDGQSWSPLGAGLNGPANALAWFGGQLIAAGAFSTAGLSMSHNIAAWNGATWSPLAEGLDGDVFDLCVFEGSLFAVGTFETAGGATTDSVARWDGAAWHAVEGGFTGQPKSLIQHEGRLFVAGTILAVNDAPTGLIAELACTNPCPPDITTTAIPGQPGYLVPDGQLNNDDFFAYLIEFIAGNLAVCDLTTTAVQGLPGYGVPNGQITNDDFFYYLILFSEGC